MTGQKTIITELIEQALDARKRAFVPYSSFPVGAALEAADGSIWTGCNVESSSFSLTVCAERVALLKAVSEGKTSFTRLVVVAAGHDLVFPCGACRQLLYDFAPDLEITVVDAETKEWKTLPFNEIFPHPFSKDNLA